MIYLLIKYLRSDFDHLIWKSIDIQGGYVKPFMVFDIIPYKPF